MLGALWTGISGLSSQQQALDNESNNIANVNTIGYKASRISFADQMYQNKIGKGSKILDAEKLYEQGNLKPTGVAYDMALSGEGFFSVLNTRTSGVSEIAYTRAGNFRMGDNGTLQDSAGNEVQGWKMTAIDPEKDVTSTNPNVKMFTNDYSKLLSSKIVRHNTYVETITAKATDFETSAKSDSSTVFNGAGLKTKQSKISDIQEAIKDYSNWLQKLKDTPDGSSESSIAQISQINFKSGNEALISKDGEQIYVVIDGNKISQNFVVTKASQSFKKDLWDQLSPADRTSYGLVDPGTVASPTTLTDTQQGAYDIVAGRIATYQALANLISEKPGLEAYMVNESRSTTPAENDVLQLDEDFNLSTKLSDMIKGIIEIKSLIPGKEVKISEVAEVAGSNSTQGSYQTEINASLGSGVGALESSKDALARLITGKQQDVYTTKDIFDNGSGGTYSNFKYSLNIYDKDLKRNIPVPNNNGTPPQAVPLTFNATNIDEFITNFKAANDALTSNPKPLDYIEMKNINGNLVVQTLDKNYDVDFSGELKTNTDIPLEKNNDYSGRHGAGAEFIEVVNKVDQTASKGSLQLKLDNLSISESAFGEFSVDKTGLIMMKQDDAFFAVGQVAIALFNNNRGLEPAGDNLLSKTNESGEPIYNLNNRKTASVEGKTLELSKAELSESLVNLMVFQRAFEANAKSITTSDEILNTLINLKR